MKCISITEANRIFPLLSEEEQNKLIGIDLQFALLNTGQSCSCNGVSWDGDPHNQYERECVREALYAAEYEIFEPYLPPDEIPEG